MPKNIGDTAMSLREELTPVRTGTTSRVNKWLEGQTQEFKTEFNELVHDHTIGHTQLLNLAKKYELDIEVGAFSDWRKKQWASKTN